MSSDKWSEVPQHARVYVACKVSICSLGARCRGCDVFVVDPERVIATAAEDGIPRRMLDLPSAPGDGSVWGKSEACFSHPTIGFFCPKCSDGIEAKLAAILRANGSGA